jgi:hypothetical protein
MIINLEKEKRRRTRGNDWYAAKKTNSSEQCPFEQKRKRVPFGKK